MPTFRQGVDISVGTHPCVRTILTHSKDSGWLTSAKTSRKRHTKELKMPESEWRRTPQPDAKMVDDATFRIRAAAACDHTINKSEDHFDEPKIDLGNAWTADSNTIRRTPVSHFSSLFSPTYLVP